MNELESREMLVDDEEDDIPAIEIFENDFMENLPGTDGFYRPFLALFPENAIDTAAISSLLFPPPEEISDSAVYDFKVRLGPSGYRVIQCAGTLTFADLHIAIQKAFDFGNDHLYSFFMDGKRWSRHTINSPFSEQPPHADEICIGGAGLREKQRFLYLFDFGDEWAFDVTVTSVFDMDSPPPHPVVIAMGGEIPKQYPDWEEDENE